MEYKAAQVLFRPTLEKLTWKLISAMSSMFLNYMFKQLVPSFSEQSYREVTGQMGGNDLEALKKMNSRQRSGHGFLLDLVQTNKLSTELLQQITCPTLIMHSKTMQRYA